MTCVVVFVLGGRGSSVVVKGGDEPGHQVQEDGAKQGLDACKGFVVPKQQLSQGLGSRGGSPRRLLSFSLLYGPG